MYVFTHSFISQAYIAAHLGNSCLSISQTYIAAHLGNACLSLYQFIYTLAYQDYIATYLTHVTVGSVQ